MKKTGILLTACLCLFLFSNCSQQKDYLSEKGFTKLLTGNDWTGWYFKIRSGDADVAKEVYHLQDGVVHVFNEQFPDSFNILPKGTKGSNDCATHGLFYTQKKYSRFILRFEYKWGLRVVANNFKDWQHDAGVYYHVVNDKIWPEGVEYQIRYDQITDTNHTGNFWGVPFEWTCDETGHFAMPSEGGKVQPAKKGQRLAKITRAFNGMNDQWNTCEIIVMANKYSIHKLNGEIINMALNMPMSSGKIGFQSETSEIFYRNIRIKEIKEDVPMSYFVKNYK